jgi:hypothetical protein
MSSSEAEKKSGMRRVLGTWVGTVIELGGMVGTFKFANYIEKRTGSKWKATGTLVCGGLMTATLVNLWLKHDPTQKNGQNR